MYGERGGAANLVVQCVGLVNVIIDDGNVKVGIGRGGRGQVLDQLPQLGASNAIGAINGQAAAGLVVAHGLLVGRGQLLIVTLLGGLAVFILGALGVDAADEIVELRGSGELVVGVFGGGVGEGFGEALYKTRARSTSVTSEDDTRWGIEIDLQRLDQVVVDGDDGIVALGVGEHGGILFPRGFQHLTLWQKVSERKDSVGHASMSAYHRVDQLDSIVLGWVVAGGDHDTNGLAIELARAQRGEQADTVYHRVKDIAKQQRDMSGLRFRTGRGASSSGCGDGVRGETYAFMRNCRETLSAKVASHIGHCARAETHSGRAILEGAHELSRGAALVGAGLDSLDVTHCCGCCTVVPEMEVSRKQLRGEEKAGSGSGDRARGRDQDQGPPPGVYCTISVSVDDLGDTSPAKSTFKGTVQVVW